MELGSLTYPKLNSVLSKYPHPKGQAFPFIVKMTGEEALIYRKEILGEGEEKEGEGQSDPAPTTQLQPQPQERSPSPPKILFTGPVVKWVSSEVLHGVCCWPKNDMDIISVKRKYIFFLNHAILCTSLYNYFAHICSQTFLWLIHSQKCQKQSCEVLWKAKKFINPLCCCPLKRACLQQVSYMGQIMC